MAGINPELTQRGMDIWLKNLSAPGMDLMAERFRQSLLEQGAIPFEQMTDEEQAKAQEQASQPPQEDPIMVAARAEEGKAQAAQMEAQNKQQVSQMDAQVKMADIQLRNRIVDLDTQKFIREKDDKYNVDAATIHQNQQKIDQNAQKMINDFSLKLADMEEKYNKQLDAQVQSNMLVFDPSTGDFVRAN